jgi:beta-lactamase regulating signal transducer with metallopeptidase domain
MNLESLATAAAWAWRTSVHAWPLALAAVVLWRWVSPRWRWWLPVLFFARLALPQVPEIAWPWASVEVTQIAPAVSAMSGEAADVPSSSAAVSIWPAVLPMIWAAGVIAIAGWLAISQWRLRRTIALGACMRDEALQQLCDWAAARLGLTQRVPVRIEPGMSTVAVCGWWKPLLLAPHDLSARFSTGQLRGMLLHEMAHVRRRDVLWTWVALGLCALHWFNPFAWLALRRFHADRELVCDAAAVEALAPAARRDYGEALLLCLRLAPAASAPALAPFFRRFSELQQRLQNIMKPTSPSLTRRIVASLLVASLVAITFTVARAEPRDAEPAKAAEGEKKAEPAARDGERKPEGARDGERPKNAPRDGEPRRAAARDGEAKKDAPRDGESRRAAARDGEAKKDGARDGETRRAAARDGDAKKDGPRDGETRRAAARDGDAKKDGPRDGDVRRTGPRDGERKPAEGARDGERKPEGLRDGDRKPAGARDGDRKPEGARDGDTRREAARDGDRKPAE